MDMASSVCLSPVCFLLALPSSVQVNVNPVCLFSWARGGQGVEGSFQGSCSQSAAGEEEFYLRCAAELVPLHGNFKFPSL